jgi:hypothetical protein
VRSTLLLVRLRHRLREALGGRKAAPARRVSDAALDRLAMSRARVELARARRFAERTVAIAGDFRSDGDTVRRRELLLAALLSTEEVARRVDARQRRLARRPLPH